MHSLLTLGLVALDMTGTLRLVGIIGGLVLLIVWWLSVKNTTALFYDKAKIRATIMFAVPGLILLLVGIFLFVTAKSMSSYFYVANYSDKQGKVEVAGSEYVIESDSWKMIEIRSNEDSYAVKGFLGDSVVFDTTMGDGSWIGNLSDDKIVVAEEVEYSASSFGSAPDDLAYELLMSPGIARFSEDCISDLYDFDETAPQTMSVSSSSSRVRKFDLQLMSQEEMFKMMMDAMGGEDGGSSLDSLFDSIEDEEVSEEGAEEAPAEE